MSVQVLSDNTLRVRTRTRTQMRAAIEETLAVGKEEAIRRCPVSDEDYPGKVHLFETIEGAVSETSEGFRADLTAGDAPRGVDYAPYPEFGTVFQAPQPYMGPAREVMRKQILSSARSKFRSL